METLDSKIIALRARVIERKANPKRVQSFSGRDSKFLRTVKNLSAKKLELNSKSAKFNLKEEN